MDVELGFIKQNYRTDQEFDPDVLAKFFIKVSSLIRCLIKQAFQNQIFAPAQKLAMDYRSVQMKVVVRSVECVDLTISEKGGDGGSGSTTAGHIRGILTPETVINFFKSPDSNIRIKASAKRPPPNAIIQPNFKFEDMGIGGLDSEFGAIFRRAFASRIFPTGLVEKLGIQHVRGNIH
jgi:vesicle-fusing ATPase